MHYLSKLENESIYIIREAYYQFKGKIAVLWSMGKDSTACLHLCRKAFLGKIPFPVIHIDTSFKFLEIYNQRKKLAKEWSLDLIVSRNEEAIKAHTSPSIGKLECCTRLKTNALQQTIKDYDFKALLLAIRRDEHGSRAKERIFSPRNENFGWDYKNQPPEMWNQYKSAQKDDEHTRVHPILGWTEYDIWEYVKRENISTVGLYFAKDGKRYRSIGCECCCSPIESDVDTIDKVIDELKTTRVSERSGRAQDKEASDAMQQLRVLGYM